MQKRYPIVPFAISVRTTLAAVATVSCAGTGIVGQDDWGGAGFEAQRQWGTHYAEHCRSAQALSN